MNLEKRAYERKHIVKLKTKENIYLEEPNKILCQMENFYRTLYFSQISEDTFNASAPHLNCNNIKRLDGEHQKICEGLITEEECLSGLKQFSKNKTPGSDGLTAEFYLCFWDYFAIPLKDCLNDAYQCGEMSISQKRGVISLLPKKKQRHSSPKKLATDYSVEYRLQNCYEMYGKAARENLANVDQQRSNRLRQKSLCWRKYSIDL